MIDPLPQAKAAKGEGNLQSPRCRDCADNDGTCPWDGTPCDPAADDANEAPQEPSDESA